MSTVIFGLTNTAANCYFNSLMQCLLITEKFNLNLLHDQEPRLLDHIEREDAHFIAYYKVLKHILTYKSKQRPIFNLKGLRKIFIERSTQFREDLQGDSGEFLTYFLDKIHEEIKYSSTESSVIIDNFNIKIAQEIVCHNCHNKNTTQQNNLQLFITPEDIDIRNCIENFEKQTESIAEYECDKCHTKGSCQQSQKFIHLPETLITIIKRYKFINTSILVPFDVNVNNHYYHLYGAVCHHGSLNSGHYWAVCKKNDGWYVFDDTTIKPINNISHHYFTRAYILFYSKVKSSESLVSSETPEASDSSLSGNSEDNL